MLQSLRDAAAERGLQSAVITFSQHPQTVITGKPVPLLTTTEERVALLKAQGVDEIFAFNFPVIRDLTAAEFLHILHNQCGVKCLLMGYDHRFGSDRLTEFSDYSAIGTNEGIDILQLPAVVAGRRITNHTPSSSSIRKALLQGDIETANTLLGYAYTITGEVVHGKGLGHTLGFPTANIAVPQDKLIPAAGVYAAKVTISTDSVERSAICNIGTNPTVGGTATTVELHIPDFTKDLYGTTISVSLQRFIRNERRFKDTEELKKQIKQDIQELGKHSF